MPKKKNYFHGCLNTIILLSVLCITPAAGPIIAQDKVPGTVSDVHVLLEFDGDPAFPSITSRRQTSGLSAFTGAPFGISGQAARDTVRDQIIDTIRGKFSRWPNLKFVTSTDGLSHWYTWGIDDRAYVFDAWGHEDPEYINPFLPIDPFSLCPADLVGGCARLHGKAIGGTSDEKDYLGIPIFHPTFARTFAGSFALQNDSAKPSEPALVIGEDANPPLDVINQDHIATALAQNGAHEIAHLFGAKHNCSGSVPLMCAVIEHGLAINNRGFGSQAIATLDTTLTQGATIDPHEPNDLAGQAPTLAGGAYTDLTLDNRYDQDYYRINITEDDSLLRIVWTFDRSHYGDTPPPVDEWASVSVQRAECINPEITGGGVSSGDSGANVSSLIGADDFMADADTEIDGVTIAINYGPESEDRHWDGTVEWWILADAGGMPGAVIASGNGTNIRPLQALESPLGFVDARVSFDFGQTIPLTGGTSYWLALHLQDGYGRTSVFWDGTATGATLNPARSGGELIGGVPNFTDGAFAGPAPFERAFSLHHATVCPAWYPSVSTLDDGYVFEQDHLPAGTTFLVGVNQSIPRVPLPYSMVISGTFDGSTGFLPSDRREPNDTVQDAYVFEPPGCDFTGTLNLGSDSDLDFYAINAAGSEVEAELRFDPNTTQMNLLLDGVPATQITDSDDGSMRTLTISSCGLDPSVVQVNGQHGYYELCINRTPSDVCSGAPDFIRFVGSGYFAGLKRPPFTPAEIPPDPFDRPVNREMYARMLEETSTGTIWEIVASIDYSFGLKQLMRGQLEIPRPNPAGSVPFGPLPDLAPILLFKAVPGREYWYQIPPVGSGDGTFEGPDNAITAFSLTSRDLQWDGLPDELATLIVAGERDTDGDRIADSVESATGTDPNNPDSDGDGLLDGSEDRNGNGVVDDGRFEDDFSEGATEAAETDPRVPDSDGDGLPDGLESGLTASEAGTAGFNADQDPASTTSPTNPASDGDGIADGIEDTNANGKVDAGETDPQHPDSDRDGVDDGSDPFPLDPAESADTDHDGIGNNADTDDDNDTIPDTLDQPPGRDPLLPDWAVSAGGSHVCALTDNGVECWGRNSAGQTTVPLTLANPFAASAGGHFTCALDETGAVCWGDNDHGQINAAQLVNPLAISAGQDHACALDGNAVVCWGSNSNGEISVPPLSNPVAVSAGTWHSCALDDNGVVCWGAGKTDTGSYPNYGQSMVPALDNPVDVSAGSSHTCALDATGVVCWGSDGLGQISVPATLVDPVAISAGSSHTCALDATGVVCWGSDGWGQSSVPATLVNPVAVSAGGTHTCALDVTGVVCWGRNTFGESTVPPLALDKDLDGLPDRLEDTNGNGVVDADETDPLNPDSDGDSFTDGEEIAAGTDPLDAVSHPVIHDGDVNGDSQVDIKDLLMAMRIMVGQYTPTLEQQERWDVAPLVDGVPQPDGQNNVGDYVVLLRKVMGKVDF